MFYLFRQLAIIELNTLIFIDNYPNEGKSAKVRTHND